MAKISIHSMYRAARQEEAGERVKRDKAVAEYQKRSKGLNRREKAILLDKLCDKYNFNMRYLSGFITL